MEDDEDAIMVASQEENVSFQALLEHVGEVQCIGLRNIVFL